MYNGNHAHRHFVRCEFHHNVVEVMSMVAGGTLGNISAWCILDTMHELFTLLDSSVQQLGILKMYT